MKQNTDSRGRIARYFRAYSNDYMETSQVLLEWHCEQIRMRRQKNSISCLHPGEGLYEVTFSVRTRWINTEECL